MVERGEKYIEEGGIYTGKVFGILDWPVFHVGLLYHLYNVLQSFRYTFKGYVVTFVKLLNQVQETGNPVRVAYPPPQCAFVDEFDMWG